MKKNSEIKSQERLSSELDSSVLNDETRYILSIPGLAESIIEGMATPYEECVKEIDW